MVEQSNAAFAGETGSPEARVADALIAAKPKIVSTGFDPVRLEGIVADLDAVITQKQRQAATTPVPAPGGERVVDALERLRFMQRVDKLVKAGRVTPRAEAHLRTLAGRSGDVKEFAAALSFGGLTLMGEDGAALRGFHFEHAGRAAACDVAGVRSARAGVRSAGTAPPPADAGPAGPGSLPGALTLISWLDLMRQGDASGAAELLPHGE